MSERDLRELLDLCQDVLALDASERERFLDNACEGDAGLRRAVEALLEEEADAGRFLETPARAPERSGPESAVAASEPARALWAVCSPRGPGR